MLHTPLNPPRQEWQLAARVYEQEFQVRETVGDAGEVEASDDDGGFEPEATGEGKNVPGLLDGGWATEGGSREAVGCMEEDEGVGGGEGDEDEKEGDEDEEGDEGEEGDEDEEEGSEYEEEGGEDEEEGGEDVEEDRAVDAVDLEEDFREERRGEGRQTRSVWLRGRSCLCCGWCWWI